MSITVDAIYEDGVLRLTQPLPLAEHAKVQVTVHPQSSSPLMQAHGLLGFQGTAAEAEYFAMSHDLDPQED